MKIRLSPTVAQKVLAYAAATRYEFSGFGFCQRDTDGDILVYDFVLLDVGNEGYTEIDPKKILPLIEREDHNNMRVWLHQHPINHWSGRDLQTILKEPLGSTPERVGWSVSIVLTPSGWLGRIDNYHKGISKNLEIEPSVRDAYQEIRALERAHTPFRDGANGPTRLGTPSVEDWPEDEYSDDELEEMDNYPSYGCPNLDETTTEQLFRELALYTSDPTTVTLAEVFADYGVDWKKIQKEES